MNKFIIWAPCLLGSFAAFLAQASSEYNPTLGVGVNFSETKTFRNCLSGITTVSQSSSPSLSRIYNETRITSQKDLEASLNITAAVRAKGLWGSVGGSVSRIHAMSVNSDSFYWLIDANYEKSSEAVSTNASGFGLTPEVAVALSSGKLTLNEFYQMCGSHFYSGRKIGARYSVVYEISSTQGRVVDQLNAQAKANAFGVRVSGGLSSAINSAAAEQSLKVHSQIIGGDHEILDYVTDPGQLVSQLAKLKQQLYVDGKGDVLNWYITSYDIFPEVLVAKRRAKLQNLTDQLRNSALEAYYLAYQTTQEVEHRALHYIKLSEGDEPYYVFSLDGRKRLDDILTRAQQRYEELARLAKDWSTSQ